MNLNQVPLKDILRVFGKVAHLPGLSAYSPMLRGLFGRSASRGESQLSDEAIEESSQRRDMASRIERGESISDDEIRSTPIDRLPRQLMERRAALMWESALSMARQVSGLYEAPTTDSTPTPQAERDLRTDLEAITKASSATGITPAPKQAPTQATSVTQSETAIERPAMAPATTNPSPQSTTEAWKQATSEAGGQPRGLPSFYHQKDDAGNTLASLLDARKQARGRVQKAEVKRQIDTWTAQFDAQRKGTSQRSEYAAATPAAPSVVQQWTEAAVGQPANRDAPSSPTPLGQPIAQTLQTIAKVQDKVLQGEAAPAQPVMSTMPQPAQSARQPAEPSPAATSADAAQLALDGVGVFGDAVVPGLGVVADGANAAISVGRAITDPARRGEHLRNAAISTVSMVPFVGDLAKLGKTKSAGRTVGRLSNMWRGADAAAGITKGQQRENLRQAAGATMPTSSGDGDGPEPIGPMPANQESPSDTQDEQEGVASVNAWTDAIRNGTEKMASMVPVIGKMALKAAAFVEGLSLLNTGVLALNRDLAQYNGGLAQSYAVADAKDIQRDIRKGESLEGPLSRLNDAQSELQDRVATIAVPMQAFFIESLALLTKVANVGLAIAQAFPAVQAALWAIELAMPKPDEQTSTDWQTFFQDVSDGKFDGKRPTFDGKREQIFDDADNKEVFGS